EIRTAELQRRDIDRDGQPRPIAAIETGAAQDKFAERHDQAGMFGDRNKARWRNFTMDGVDPARERFNADQALAARIDDRLINDVQLLVFDRLAERTFEQFAVGKSASIAAS